MRKYKFRGKEVDTGKWVYGGLFKEPAPPQCFEKTLEDKYWIVYPNPRYMPDWNLPYEMVRTDIEKETIGQYTGLKDKNGKEIYEGDIVKVKLYKGEEEKYFIGKVEYFGSNFIVDADNNSEYHVYDLDGFGIDYRYNLEDCEVIGNIYDNPELLEEGE